MRFDGVMPRRRRPARARGPPADRPTKKKKKARRRSEGRGGRARPFFFFAGAARPDFLPCCRPPARARAQQTEQIIYLFTFCFFAAQTRKRRRFLFFIFLFLFLFIFRAARAAPPFEVRFGLALGAFFFFFCPARRPCWVGPAAGFVAGGDLGSDKSPRSRPRPRCGGGYATAHAADSCGIQKGDEMVFDM